MSKQGKTTRFIVYTGLLSALAIILYILEFPVFSGYLKIDAGDLPAAIGGVMMGPVAAVVIELIKVVVGFIIKGSSTMGFGDLINFIVGIALTVPFAAVFRAVTKRGHGRYLAVILGGIAGMAVMVAVGVVANYLIAPPYFNFVMHVKLSGAALWAAIGSASILNLLKSVLVMVVMLPVIGALKGRMASVR